MNDELEHEIERIFGANSAGLSWNRATVSALAALVARREREAVRAFIEQGWGPRCKTKDAEDFPELKDHLDGRCATCEMWEVYDEYFELKAGGKQE